MVHLRCVSHIHERTGAMGSDRLPNFANTIILTVGAGCARDFRTWALTCDKAVPIRRPTGAADRCSSKLLIRGEKKNSTAHCTVHWL